MISQEDLMSPFDYNDLVIVTEHPDPAKVGRIGVVVGGWDSWEVVVNGITYPKGTVFITVEWADGSDDQFPKETLAKYEGDDY
jgi:hypothetical protein